jgi:hypothetical protein
MREMNVLETELAELGRDVVDAPGWGEVYDVVKDVSRHLLGDWC